MSIKVYVAKAMTGRLCSELVQEAKGVRWVLEQYGIEVLDPVLLEEVPDVPIELDAHDELKLHLFWERDKQCIREAHVVIDTTAARKSVGVEHEIGLARFAYWKPLVRIYPPGYSLPFISRYEDDAVTDDLGIAAEMVVDIWGTYPKRLWWRLKMLGRSLPKFIFRQIRFLLQ